MLVDTLSRSHGTTWSTDSGAPYHVPYHAPYYPPANQEPDSHLPPSTHPPGSHMDPSHPPSYAAPRSFHPPAMAPSPVSEHHHIPPGFGRAARNSIGSAAPMTPIQPYPGMDAVGHAPSEAPRGYPPVPVQAAVPPLPPQSPLSADPRLSEHPPFSDPRPRNLSISTMGTRSPPPPSVVSSPHPRSADALRISTLLGGEGGAPAAVPANTVSGERKRASPVRRLTSEFASRYSLTIRQQPIAARSCGFGERDRRVIDPPPILQVSIDDSGLPAEESKGMMQHQFSVMHCTIWDEMGQQDVSNMPDEYRQQRRLMGSSVSTPFLGTDEFDKSGCFFCFPDLSCRTNGNFRLKFSLVVLTPNRGLPGAKSPVVATAMSEVFTVYTAKDFPGMQASSPLTKKLKEQGCLISIKKGNEKGHNSRDDSDEDDEDEDEYSEKPKKKSRKTN